MNKLTKDTKILIVGLGVMGGGYAAALSREGYDVSCITKEECDVKYALEHGMIKYGTTEIEPALVGSADLVVFALYPGVFLEWIEKNQNLFKSGAIITDVTGVKSNIVDRVQSMLRPDIEFISSHPMAGREKSGVEFSNPDVFRGANYIVVPTEKNTADGIDTCRELGKTLGFARISTLSMEEHDKMIAFLSQLTHCIAVALMTANATPGLEKYTGDSYRDLTRIAKINDAMWSELFMLNKDLLLAEMDAFSLSFNKLRDALKNDDVETMRELMRAATSRRELFDKPEA